MDICWFRMRKKWLKLNSRALRAQKWWLMIVGKIDDNGVIVNKKK